jgi:hypothetical protein
VARPRLITPLVRSAGVLLEGDSGNRTSTRCILEPKDRAVSLCDGVGDREPDAASGDAARRGASVEAIEGVFGV